MIPAAAVLALAAVACGYWLAAGDLRVWAAAAGGGAVLAAGLLFAWGGYRAANRREHDLLRCLQAIGNPAKENSTIEEELRRLHSEVQALRRQTDQEREECRNYVASWAEKAAVPLESIRQVKEALQKENNPACLYLERERLALYAMFEQLQSYFSCAAGNTRVAVAEVELSKLVSEAVTRNAKLFNAKSIGLKRAVNKAKVYSDPRLLSAALDLLLDNAVKFSGEGAVLGLTCRETPEGIRLAVEDSGTGIPSEELPKIFDKGFTGVQAPAGSPGMGLYLVKSYLDLLGHPVTVESQLRRGTRVSILFCPPYPADTAQPQNE